MYDFLIGADLSHLIVAVAGALLFFLAVADLIKPRRRPWRRFASLSVVSLALGAHSAPLPDILVFVVTWVGIVTMVVLTDTYDPYRMAQMVPAVAIESGLGAVGTGAIEEDWNDLPAEAQRVLAQIQAVCRAGLRSGLGPKAEDAREMTIDVAKYTLSEMLVRYVPDTLAAYRSDRDRIAKGGSLRGDVRAKVESELVAQLERLRDRLEISEGGRSTSPALERNRLFLAERFEKSDDRH